LKLDWKANDLDQELNPDSDSRMRLDSYARIRPSGLVRIPSREAAYSRNLGAFLGQWRAYFLVQAIPLS